MDREVFIDKKVIDFFNKNFINCKIQCDDKGEGEKLKNKFKVSAFPTLMFIDKNSNVIHCMAGAPDPNGLISFAKEAIDPTKNLYFKLKRYKEGDRDDKTVSNYFNSLLEASRVKQARKDFEIYFNKITDSKKKSLFIYNQISKIGFAPFTPTFEYIENNKSHYAKLVGEEVVEKFIFMHYLGYFSSALKSNEDNKEKYLLKFKQKGYKYYDEIVDYLYVFDAVWNKEQKNKDKEFTKRASKFISTYGYDKDIYALSFVHMLGNLTWGHDKGIEGVEWMRELLKKERNIRYLRTYFYILQRNLRWDESKEIAIEIRGYYLKNGMSTKRIDNEIADISRLKKKYR